MAAPRSHVPCQTRDSKTRAIHRRGNLFSMCVMTKLTINNPQNAQTDPKRKHFRGGIGTCIAKSRLTANTLLLAPLSLGLYDIEVACLIIYLNVRVAQSFRSRKGVARKTALLFKSIWKLYSGKMQECCLAQLVRTPVGD